MRRWSAGSDWGPGSAGLGRVRKGWRQGNLSNPRQAKVSRVLAGLGLWSCGREPWRLGVKQVLTAHRWRGRSKQAKDETRG